MPQPGHAALDALSARERAARRARIDALEREGARQSAANGRYVLTRGLFGLVLLVPLLLLAYGLDHLDPVRWLVRYLGVAAALVLLGAGIIFAVTLELPFAPASIRREIALLQDEQTQIKAAAALVASGEPFALFLRGFDAEIAGARESGDKNRLVGEMTSYAQIASGGTFTPSSPDYFPPEVLDQTGVWRTQSETLTALSRRFPVVLLGNARLDDSMASAAERMNPVRQIMMVTEDWWDVFCELARHARIVVVFIAQRSASLQRELDHLACSGARAIVVCAADQDAGEAGGPRSALQFVTFNDHRSFDAARIEAALDAALGWQ